MLEDNTKNICEPYIGVAKKCLNFMEKEDMLVNDIDKVYECVKYLVQFSKLNNHFGQDLLNIDAQDK